MKKRINLLDTLPDILYAICWIEGQLPYGFTNTLTEILHDSNDEYKYAIHEKMEDVLMLPVGGRLKIWFNRDNTKDSEGFIKRIK